MYKRQEVPWTNSVKYLGLHVDSRLTWRTHTTYIRQRASAQLSRLWPVLSNPAMTPRLGKLIVNLYVLPVITYACPVWGYLARGHRTALQRVLDRGLKLAYKVPRWYSSRHTSVFSSSIICIFLLLLPQFTQFPPSRWHPVKQQNLRTALILGSAGISLMNDWPKLKKKLPEHDFLKSNN